MKKSALLTLLLLHTLSSYAIEEKNSLSPTSLYIGALGGAGTTTWYGLVPKIENQNLALGMSMPTEVQEGGSVWGAFAGYEFTRTFAIEMSYMRYPNATVTFDPMSLFSFLNNDLVTLTTKTEMVDLKAKLMVPLPRSNFRVFSSVGAAGVHRNDLLVNQWHISPAFSAGINYHMSDHLMGEIAGNYTAGFGEAQLNPSDSYVPFLYSIVFRLAYCV